MQKRYLYILAAVTTLLSSCGNNKALTVSENKTTSRAEISGIEHDLLNASSATAESDASENEEPPTDYNAALYKLIDEWKGTPHKMGGNSKDGVDCSGLVCIVYDKVYANSFKNRRARDIFTEVEEIKKEDLQEGDLVFFKIYNRNIDHIGIYLKDGNFLHSSSSRGVMISNLEEDYFKKRFYKGGRKKS